MSQYATSLQKPQLTNEQRQELQTWWLAQLKSFATAHPSAPETAEALFQLAMAQEFAGKTDESAKWYEQLVKTHPNTEAGQRAAGRSSGSTCKARSSISKAPVSEAGRLTRPAIAAKCCW